MIRDRASTYYNMGWVDTLAISMSALCALHCLITPALLVAIPVLTQTFWIDHNFHLWMLALVIPTTSLAVISGCRRHKDKAIMALSTLGLVILLSTALHESFSSGALLNSQEAHCPNCASVESPQLLNATTLFSLLGGLFLISAHIRNFILCRKAKCDHECDSGRD